MQMAKSQSNTYTADLDWSHFHDNSKIHQPRQFNFFYLDFLSQDSLITGLQGKGEGNSLTLQYHFHPLHRQLVISQAITEESSTLHIASSQTQTQIFHWSICAESNLNNQMKQGEISQNLNQQTSSPLSLQKNEVFH